MIEHFHVQFTLMEAPKGMTTAAMRSCMLCRVVLTAMGGGGNYICRDCVDNLWKPETQDYFRGLKEE